jgi:hypothetical protein
VWHRVLIDSVLLLTALAGASRLRGQAPVVDRVERHAENQQTDSELPSFERSSALI